MAEKVEDLEGWAELAAQLKEALDRPGQGAGQSLATGMPPLAPAADLPSPAPAGEPEEAPRFPEAATPLIPPAVREFFAEPPPSAPASPAMPAPATALMPSALPAEREEAREATPSPPPAVQPVQSPPPAPARFPPPSPALPSAEREKFSFQESEATVEDNDRFPEQPPPLSTPGLRFPTAESPEKMESGAAGFQESAPPLPLAPATTAPGGHGGTDDASDLTAAMNDLAREIRALRDEMRDKDNRSDRYGPQDDGSFRPMGPGSVLGGGFPTQYERHQ